MNAYQALDKELERLHKELNDIMSTSNNAYKEILTEIRKINAVLIELAKNPGNAE